MILPMTSIVFGEGTSTDPTTTENETETETTTVKWTVALEGVGSVKVDEISLKIVLEKYNYLLNDDSYQWEKTKEISKQYNKTNPVNFETEYDEEALYVISIVSDSYELQDIYVNEGNRYATVLNANGNDEQDDTTDDTTVDFTRF